MATHICLQNKLSYSEAEAVSSYINSSMQHKHVLQSCGCSLQPNWVSCSGLGCSVCFSWLPFHEEGTKTVTFKSAVSVKSTPEVSDEVTSLLIEVRAETPTEEEPEGSS